MKHRLRFLILLKKYRNDGEKTAEHYKRTLLQRSFITIIMEKIMTLRIKKPEQKRYHSAESYKGQRRIGLIRMHR